MRIQKRGCLEQRRPSSGSEEITPAIDWQRACNLVEDFAGYPGYRATAFEIYCAAGFAFVERQHPPAPRWAPAKAAEGFWHDFRRLLSLPWRRQR